MDDIIVSFPSPCVEKWDDMSPHGCNRHCASCDKIIYDLSALSVEEGEALLASNNEICVRARIGKDGVVRTANTKKHQSRRIIAALGASLSLATAACQTTASPNVTPRYEITGQFTSLGWHQYAILKSETGKTSKVRIWKDGKFRFTNLKSGTYSLSIYGVCGQLTNVAPITVDKDVALGLVKDDGKEDDCIIIGHMVRKTNLALKD